MFWCRAQQHMEQTLDGLCVRVAHNHTFDGLWLRMANDFNRLQGKSAIRVSAHVIHLPCSELCYAVSDRAVLCYAVPCCAVLPYAVLCCSCCAVLSCPMMCCNMQHLFHAVANNVLCYVLLAVQLFGRLDVPCCTVCCYLSATHNTDLWHLALLLT